ncbi:MAG: TolC family protein [Nitrospirae bacterium]|nr:TolC family protein [Nitrospirota bacterium]
MSANRTELAVFNICNIVWTLRESLLQDTVIPACRESFFGAAERIRTSRNDSKLESLWPVYFSLFNIIVTVCLMSLSTLIFTTNAEAETTQKSDYQSLSLEDCLALAGKYNPALSGARERIRELISDYQAAKSQFFPQLVLLSYYERLEPNRLPPGGSTGSPTQDFNKDEAFAGIAGKQILFNGGKTYYGAQSAKIGAEAQKQEVLRTGDEVAFTVTAAFYRVVEAKENLNVAEEALKQRQEFLNLTEAFFKAGKVTQLDSFRAKSLVSEAEQAKVETENALRLAREILVRTIGLNEDEQVQVDVRGRLTEEFPPAPDIDSLWQATLKSNPEIRRINLEIQQSQTLVKAAKGAYFPEVSLRGDIGTRHQDIGGTRGEWLAGVFMEFPFFEGGLTKTQVAAASSRYLQSLERKRDRLNSLKIELATAWQDQENARQGVAATRQTVATNEEAYASAQALYRNGKAIGLDVLQAQVDLTGSRFGLIRYEVNYEIARARVRQILGSQDFESSQQNDKGGQKK